MLQDKHLLWDDTWAMDDVIEKVRVCIQAFPANKEFWGDEREDWHNLFALVGLEYGVNPGWLLTCAQRERSLAGKTATPASYDLALGVAGQDNPGLKFARYSGFSNQLVRAARITAWHLGNDWQPRRKGLEPSTEPRWRPMGINTITLKDDAGKDLPGKHLCESASELSQLRFTPHLKVLVVNDETMRSAAPLFY